MWNSKALYVQSLNNLAEKKNDSTLQRVVPEYALSNSVNKQFLSLLKDTNPWKRGIYHDSCYVLQFTCLSPVYTGEWLCAWYIGPKFGGSSIKRRHL